MRKPITTAILTALFSTVAASTPPTSAWAAAKHAASAPVKVLAPKGTFVAGTSGVEVGHRPGPGAADRRFSGIRRAGATLRPRSAR